MYLYFLWSDIFHIKEYNCNYTGKEVAIYTICLTEKTIPKLTKNYFYAIYTTTLFLHD